MDGIEYRCFNHLYAVSRCGLVLRQMKPYTPKLRYDGYVTLGSKQLMHRAVAECWCEHPSGANHVHHINGDKADNRAENLEWLTPRQHFTERHEDIPYGKHIRTAETRAKLSAARAGKRDSAETRAKKAAILDAVRVKRRPFEFQGVSYPSVSAAARAAGLHLSTFRLWHLPKNQPTN